MCVPWSSHWFRYIVCFQVAFSHFLLSFPCFLFYSSQPLGPPLSSSLPLISWRTLSRLWLARLVCRPISAWTRSLRWWTPEERTAVWLTYLTSTTSLVLTESSFSYCTRRRRREWREWFNRRASPWLAFTAIRTRYAICIQWVCDKYVWMRSVLWCQLLYGVIGSVRTIVFHACIVSSFFARVLAHSLCGCHHVLLWAFCWPMMCQINLWDPNLHVDNSDLRPALASSSFSTVHTIVASVMVVRLSIPAGSRFPSSSTLIVLCALLSFSVCNSPLPIRLSQFRLPAITPWLSSAQASAPYWSLQMSPRVVWTFPKSATCSTTPCPWPSRITCTGNNLTLGLGIVSFKLWLWLCERQSIVSALSRPFCVNTLWRLLANLHCPLLSSSFQFRIGRTARAGEVGVAHTLFTELDKHHSGELVGILREANQEVPEVRL